MIFSLILYTCLVGGGPQTCRMHQVNIDRMSLGQCFMASQTEAAKYWEDTKHTRIVVGSKCTDRPAKFLHSNEA